MDADQLRLVLLLAGMALVAAIYLWDRYQRSRRRLKGLSLRKARKIRKELGLDEPEQVPSFSAERTEISPEPGVTLRLIEREGKAESASERTSAQSEPQQPELELEPPPSAPEPSESLAPPADAPQLVVQIGLRAREGALRGADIQRVMAEIGLEPGAMRIFHRLDARHPGHPLFSVANMVEPGHFPLEAMDDFTTPGLLFFAQLPGVRDGLEIYSEMLFAANQAAESLDGVLLDENRAVLTRQSIQHTRDAIAEHRRRVRLAQKVRSA